MNKTDNALPAPLSQEINVALETLDDGLDHLAKLASNLEDRLHAVLRSPNPTPVSDPTEAVSPLGIRLGSYNQRLLSTTEYLTDIWNRLEL